MWEKLGLRTGSVMVASAPPAYEKWLAGSPVVPRLHTAASRGRPARVENAWLFARSLDEAASQMHLVLPHVGATTNLIVSYEKARLDGDDLRDVVESLGFRVVCGVAIDRVWSAIRFVKW